MKTLTICVCLIALCYHFPTHSLSCCFRRSQGFRFCVKLIFPSMTWEIRKIKVFKSFSCLGRRGVKRLNDGGKIKQKRFLIHVKDSLESKLRQQNLISKFFSLSFLFCCEHNKALHKTPRWNSGGWKKPSRKNRVCCFRFRF